MSVLTFPATVAPMDGPEDRARLIAAAKAGDLAAFEQVIRQHERLVLVTALRLLGNLADARTLPRKFSCGSIATSAKWNRAAPSPPGCTG